MDIVACTDNNYVMPTGVMIYSVCCNNADVNITFHIITGGVEIQGKEQLIRTIEPFTNKTIVFYDAKELDISVFPQMENCLYPTSAFYRLMINELLPVTLNKVLYLDVDLIVRQSLLPLWNVELEDYAIAAIPDWHVECSDFDKRLNYPKELGYINTGVLLINLEYWRTHNVLNSFIDYMIQHADKIIYADQDILNYVFRENKMILPIKYNLQTGLIWNCTKEQFDEEEYNRIIQESLRDCVIVHYSGGKPWKKGCRHPFRRSFHKYYSQTLWKNDPLQETRPLKLRIIKFFSTKLRRLKLIPELPPYGKEFIEGLEPLD